MRPQSPQWECPAADGAQQVVGALPPLLGVGAVVAAAVGLLQSHHVLAVVHSSGPAQSDISSSSRMQNTIVKRDCGVQRKGHILSVHSPYLGHVLILTEKHSSQLFSPTQIPNA